MDKSLGVAWLDQQLSRTTQPLLDTKFGCAREVSIRQTRKCGGGLQPEETGTAFPQLPEQDDGERTSGIDGGSDARQRDATAAKHARDFGLGWMPYPRCFVLALLRGDIAYGNESPLRKAEACDQPYLTKLRVTKNVKSLIQKPFHFQCWEEAGQGWEDVEDRLRLSGWSRSRRVAVPRKKLIGDLLVTGTEIVRNSSFSWKLT